MVDSEYSKILGKDKGNYSVYSPLLENPITTFAIAVVLGYITSTLILKSAPTVH